MILTRRCHIGRQMQQVQDAIEIRNSLFTSLDLMSLDNYAVKRVNAVRSRLAASGISLFPLTISGIKISKQSDAACIFLFRVLHSFQSSAWSALPRKNNKCQRSDTLQSVFAENAVTYHSDNHNHAPDPSKIVAKEVLGIMKSSSEFTSAPAETVAQATASLPVEVLAVLPEIDSMKQMIRRKRNTHLPSFNPTNLKDLEIPAVITLTGKSVQFLAFDSGPDTESRVLVFATDENMDILKQSAHWFSDGTFKTAPPLFDQLFVIHGQFNGIILPLVYCLMPNRKEETYDVLFNFLASKLEDFEPQTMLSDFEVASRKSFNTYFPGSTQRGCYFHLMQSVWRHVQQEPEILNKYKRETDFACKIRYLTALAFCPIRKVIKDFESLQKLQFFKENRDLLQPLMTYFEHTWIGAKRGTRRSKPLFALDLWNVNEAVSED